MSEKILNRIKTIPTSKAISILGMLIIAFASFMPMAVIESTTGAESKYLYYNGIPLLVVSVVGAVLVAKSKYWASIAAFIMDISYIAYLIPVVSLNALIERSVAGDSVRLSGYMLVMLFGMGMLLVSCTFLPRMQRNRLRRKHIRWLAPLFAVVFVSACALGNYHSNQMFFDNGTQTATQLRDKLAILQSLND
jgi:hypothetical protein